MDNLPNDIKETIFRSQHYDDVYFSAQDGLAETRYVFLDGNDLKTKWSETPPAEPFHIAETGFGTGLNFLATVKLWKQSKPTPNATLHFTSVEKHPLDKDTIARALSPWKDDLAQELEPYLDAYPADLSHDIHLSLANDHIKLSVLIGDATQRYAQENFQAGAWFLDGFRPAANPDMWTQDLFHNIARLSTPEATLSSFTAAGFVRRGLQEAGFTIHKKQGFGRKREMIVGVKNG